MIRTVNTGLLILLASAGAAHAQHGQPAGGHAAPPTSPPIARAENQEEEIVVLANPGDQVRIDRRTYALRDDAAAQSTNMFDVLGRIPAVSVAPSGNVTLLGAGNVLIQINGQPVPDINLEQVLRGLNGADVERIEVITNPPAQFSAQASGGIINIITRQERRLGWNGSAQASIDTNGASYLGFSPTWSNGPWTIGGQLGLFGGQTQQEFERTRDKFSPASTVTEHGDQTVDSVGFSLGRLQFGYRPDARRRASVSFDYIDVRNDTARPTATERDGVAASEQQSDTDTHFYNHQVNLDFQQTGDTPQELLRITGFLQNHGAEFDQMFEQTPSGGSLGQFRSINNVSLLNSNAKVDYERRAFGGMLTLGSSLDASAQDFDNSRETLIGGPNPLDYVARLDGEQQTIAGYGTYQFELGGWTFQPGLRLETYRRALVAGATEDDSIDERAFPSVHVRRDLSDNLALTLSYTSRIQRPGFNQLDPTLRFVDLDRAIGGNPDLLPTTTDAYEINLAYQNRGLNWGITFYDRIAEDVVSPFVETTPSGVIVTAPVNADTSEQRGLQALVRGPLGNRWRYSFTANLLNREFDALSGGTLSRRDEFEYDGVAQLDYRDADQSAIGADLLQFEVRFQGPRYTLQSDFDEFIVANFTWRRRLTSQMFGSLSFQDILSTQDQIQETSTLDYFERAETQGVGARVRLALTYQFGGGALSEPPPEQQPVGPMNQN